MPSRRRCQLMVAPLTFPVLHLHAVRKAESDAPTAASEDGGDRERTFGSAVSRGDLDEVREMLAKHAGQPDLILAPICASKVNDVLESEEF